MEEAKLLFSILFTQFWLMTWITFSSLEEYREQNLQIKHYLLTSIQNSFFSGNLEIVLLREYNICRIKTNLKFSLWKSEFFRHFTSTCPSYHHVQERLVLTTRVLSPLKVAQKAPAFPFAELTTQIWQHKYYNTNMTECAQDASSFLSTAEVQLKDSEGEMETRRPQRHA